MEEIKFYRYKSLRIDTNALVIKGAMGVKPILKDDGHFVKVGERIFKADDEKMELTTTLVVFNKFDSQNMILDDENVRDQAMIDFIEKGNKSLKIMHETSNDENNYAEAKLKEVYVVKDTDTEWQGYEGSINATYKFLNKTDWEIVKQLELQTSIEGFGDLEEVSDVELAKSDSKLKEFIAKFKDFFYARFGKDKVDSVLLQKEDEGENTVETKEETTYALQLEKQEDVDNFINEKFSNLTKNEDNSLILNVVKSVVENIENEFKNKEEILDLIKSATSKEIEALTSEKQELEQKVQNLEAVLKEQTTPSGDTIPTDYTKIKLF